MKILGIGTNQDKLILLGLAACAGFSTVPFVCTEAALSANTGNSSKHAGKHGYHHSFAGAEQWSKKFDDPARDKWQRPEATIKALRINTQDKIVDLGAGTGYFSLRIAKAYPHATIYAADVEPSMIEYLHKQSEKLRLPNHLPVKVPANKVDLPTKVNLVLVVDTYHHIDDRITYFGALREQLMPDGRVVVIDFTAQSPEGPPPKHRISKADLQDEMKQAGYTLDQDITLLPYQYFLIFKPATIK
jgi:ubiquinone/menaquinone biosynthesis C-methylase UbiE